MEHANFFGRGQESDSRACSAFKQYVDIVSYVRSRGSWARRIEEVEVGGEEQTLISWSTSSLYFLLLRLAKIPDLISHGTPTRRSFQTRSRYPFAIIQLLIRLFKWLLLLPFLPLSLIFDQQQANMNISLRSVARIRQPRDFDCFGFSPASEKSPARTIARQKSVAFRGTDIRHRIHCTRARSPGSEKIGLAVENSEV